MKRASALQELGEAERSLPAARKLELAQQAYEEARAHRAEMRAHQREQQRAMQRFDLFRADLEAMGIQVIIEPVTHPVRIEPNQRHVPEGSSHDDRSSA